MFCRAVGGRSLTKLPNKDMIDASELAIVDADLRGAKTYTYSNTIPTEHHQKFNNIT